MVMNRLVMKDERFLDELDKYYFEQKEADR